MTDQTTDEHSSEQKDHKIGTGDKIAKTSIILGLCALALVFLSGILQSALSGTLAFIVGASSIIAGGLALLMGSSVRRSQAMFGLSMGVFSVFLGLCMGTLFAEDPEIKEAWETAQVHLEEGNEAAARSEWEAAVAAYRDAISNLEKVKAGDPERKGLATKTTEAEDGLSNARMQQAVIAAEAAMADGDGAVQNQDWEGAKTSFQKVLAVADVADKVDPENATIGALRADAEKKFDDASFQFAAFSANEAMAQGDEEANNQNWEAAMKAYQKVLSAAADADKLEPNNATINELRAEAEKKSIDSALQFAIVSANEAMVRGDAAVENQDWEEAKSAYRGVLTLANHAGDPDDPALAALAALRAEADRKIVSVDSKRLATRPFVRVSPDNLVSTMLWNSNAEEIWETKWEGKYVRWQAKFLERGFFSGITANTGNSGIIDCGSFDEITTTEELKALKKWQAITVEGRLYSVEKRAGESRAEIDLEDCVVK